MFFRTDLILIDSFLWMEIAMFSSRNKNQKVIVLFLSFTNGDFYSVQSTVITKRHYYVSNIEFSLSRIDFNQLAKPANLQNSAVLRMLEEEEARQHGKWRNVPSKIGFLELRIKKIVMIITFFRRLQSRWSLKSPRLQKFARIIANCLRLGHQSPSLDVSSLN